MLRSAISSKSSNYMSAVGCASACRSENRALADVWVRDNVVASAPEVPYALKYNHAASNVNGNPQPSCVSKMLGKIRNPPCLKSDAINERKFCFIRPLEGGEDVYFPIRNQRFADEYQHLYNGLVVEFEVKYDAKMNPIAHDVVRRGDVCYAMSIVGSIVEADPSAEYAKIIVDAVDKNKKKCGVVQELFLHKENFYGSWPWANGQKVRFNVDEREVAEAAENDGKIRFKNHLPSAFDVVDEQPSQPQEEVAQE